MKIIETAKKNEYWQLAMYCAAVAAGTGCRSWEIKNLQLAIHSLIVRLLLAIAMCGALLSAEIYFVFLIARQLWRWSERITSLVVPAMARSIPSQRKGGPHE
jgi:hypothetical protein